MIPTATISKRYVTFHRPQPDKLLNADPFSGGYAAPRKQGRSRLTLQNWHGIAIACAAFLGLGALGVATQDFGFALLLGVPFVSGLLLGRWVRVRRTLQVVCGLALLAGLIATAIAVNLAGLLCGLIAGVILGGPLVLGVWVGSLAFGRSSPAQSMACVAVIALLLPVEGQLSQHAPEETIVTELVAPVSASDAFDRFRFYEAVADNRVPLLALVLPTPVETVPVPGSDGSLVRCIYESGYLVKHITHVVPGRLIEFDVVEQSGVEDRSIELLSGYVKFESQGASSTRISMATTYRPLLSARPIWRPFEVAVVRALHTQVLEGMTNAAESPAT